MGLAAFNRARAIERQKEKEDKAEINEVLTGTLNSSEIVDSEVPEFTDSDVPEIVKNENNEIEEDFDFSDDGPAEEPAKTEKPKKEKKQKGGK